MTTRIDPTKSSPRVAIIVLNWNAFEITKECVQSLAEVDYPSFSVIVVDNGSADHSGEKLSAMFPWIELIRSDSNRGFTGGNNIALEAVLARDVDYALLLNNDTLVAPDFLKEMVRAGETASEVGVLSPKIYYEEQPDVIWYGGGSFSCWRGLPKHHQLRKRDDGRPEKDCETGFATGCALLVKRAVFNTIGVLDESFYFGGEDVDFTIRARRAGFRVLYVPAAKIWHKVSYTTNHVTGKPFRDFYNGRNRILLARKYARIYEWPIVLISLGVMLVYRTLGYTVRGEFPRIAALYKGVATGFSRMTSVPVSGFSSGF